MFHCSNEFRLKRSSFAESFGLGLARIIPVILKGILLVNVSATIDQAVPYSEIPKCRCWASVICIVLKRDSFCCPQQIVFFLHNDKRKPSEETIRNTQPISNTLFFLVFIWVKQQGSMWQGGNPVASVFGRNASCSRKGIGLSEIDFALHSVSLPIRASGTPHTFFSVFTSLHHHMFLCHNLWSILPPAKKESSEPQSSEKEDGTSIPEPVPLYARILQLHIRKGLQLEVCSKSFSKYHTSEHHEESLIVHHHLTISD